MGEILAGCLAGAIAMALLLGNFGIVPKYHEAINICEAELPRNQQCVITAVPEETSP